MPTTVRPTTFTSFPFEVLVSEETMMHRERDNKNNIYKFFNHDVQIWQWATSRRRMKKWLYSNTMCSFWSPEHIRIRVRNHTTPRRTHAKDVHHRFATAHTSFALGPPTRPRPPYVRYRWHGSRRRWGRRLWRIPIPFLRASWLCGRG